MNPFNILKSLLPYIIDLVIAPILLPIAARNKVRSEILQTIAVDIAHGLVVEFPDAPWAILVDLAIQRLAQALPPEAKTSNQEVLKRVVIGALKVAGAKPNV